MPRLRHSPPVFLHFVDRLSDSPFVERVWRCHSDRGGPFLAVASSHWEFVVSYVAGGTRFTFHGPETRAREVDCPADGEWLAIRFKAGVYMPQLPVSRLVNGNDVDLPPAFRGRVRVDGAAFEIPDFDHAEGFVERLVRRGLLVRDAAVSAALAGDEHAVRTRTLQRRFLDATGMSHAALRQVARARQAVMLLREGLPPGEVAAELNYFDQAHLTRCLRQLIGITPARIAGELRQLSYLYKTA